MSFLDESGLASTMPTGYSWSRIGERKIVPYEAPEGRRVNVVGAISPFDPEGPHLIFESRRKDQGKYDAEAHLRFVYKVAGFCQPCGEQSTPESAFWCMCYRFAAPS